MVMNMMEYINTIDFNIVIPLRLFNIGSKDVVIEFEHLDFSEIFENIKKEQEEYDEWLKKIGLKR